MFVFGLLATSRTDFQHHLPHYTGGLTAQKIGASGQATFLPGTSHHFFSDLFSTTVFPFMLGIVFLQFIGFQYSAYIAGEVRGNVKRGVMVALLGALLCRRARQLGVCRRVLEPLRVQRARRAGATTTGAA